MTWLRLDDGFPRHKKIRRLSDRAFRLHVYALCYAAEHLTDGLIEDDVPESLLPRFKPAMVAELVERGAWEVVPGGWMLHDFLDFNPSAAKVRDERVAAAERMARSRERSSQQAANKDQTNGRSSGAHGSGAPARPVGTRAGGLPDSVGEDPPPPTPDGGDGSSEPIPKAELAKRARDLQLGLKSRSA